MANKYSCTLCVNQGSPLCAVCNEAAMQSVWSCKKPRYFISEREVFPVKKIPNGVFEVGGEEIPHAQEIMERVLSLAPLPMQAVMEYNREIEKKR